MLPWFSTGPLVLFVNRFRLKTKFRLVFNDDEKEKNLLDSVAMVNRMLIERQEKIRKEINSGSDGSLGRMLRFCTDTMGALSY